VNSTHFNKIIMLMVLDYYTKVSLQMLYCIFMFIYFSFAT